LLALPVGCILTTPEHDSLTDGIYSVNRGGQLSSLINLPLLGGDLDGRARRCAGKDDIEHTLEITCVQALVEQQRSLQGCGHQIHYQLRVAARA
jgi:hypothetical protein